MIAWSELVVPILISGVLVFIASSVMHTVLKYHNSDFKKLANEDEVRAAIRKGSGGPGMYMIPYCVDHAQAKSPEHQRKFEEGPLGLLILRPNHATKIGPYLMQWMIYVLIVSALAAYMARTALPASPHYLQVFQVVGASAWLAYAWQAPSDSIWKGQSWSHSFKVLFDGLVYAALTAGVFGWWLSR